MLIITDELIEQAYDLGSFDSDEPALEDDNDLGTHLIDVLDLSRVLLDPLGMAALIKAYRIGHACDSEFPTCPKCGDPIDYCQGHGSIG